MTTKTGRLLFKTISRTTNPLPLALAVASQYSSMNRPVLLVAPGEHRIPKAPRTVRLLRVVRPWVLDIWLDARRMTPAPELLVIADLTRIGGRSTARKLDELRLLAREMDILVVVLARRTPTVAALRAK